MPLKVTLEISVHSLVEREKAIARIKRALDYFPHSLKVDQEPDLAPAEPPKPPEITMVWTDGGCDSKRNGVGAWAYLIHTPDGLVHQAVDALMQTTNNRMEMTAVIRALEFLEVGPPVRIVSDSEYVIKGASQWLKSWKRNDWTTYSGSPVKNRDLWTAIDALVSLHNVSFQHVRGHSGHEQNDYVDLKCTQAMSDAHQRFLQGFDVPKDPGDCYSEA